ncbi:hypothetical protein [Leptospira wolffii]|uniref:hypothetical protein n=1 Tax=Leptospira wolffii TaxID=409998 RepID=UPI00058C5A34|nr:hypothetical protein [Leptospira wolffii]
MIRPFVIWLLSGLCGLILLDCGASFSNKYFNEAKLQSNPFGVSVRISIEDIPRTAIATLRISYVEDPDSGMVGKLSYSYSGQELLIIRNVSLYCDTKQLSIKQIERSTQKGYRTIYERFSGILAIEDLDRLGACKDISLYARGENKSLSYNMDEEGIRLVKNFHALFLKTKTKKDAD